MPRVVQRADPIELELSEALSKNTNFSTSGQVRCIVEAIDEWKSEMDNVLFEISKSATPEQGAMLRTTQMVWEEYRTQELKWLGELRKTVRGTMYRVLGCDIDLQLVRQRVKMLREYRDDWLPARVDEQNH